MNLKSIQYSEHDGTEQEWSIDGLCLGTSNLVVGKNASGKTRALNIINALSGHLAGLRRPSLSGTFDAEFIDEKGRTLKYFLSAKDEKVTEEKFSVDNKVLLERSDGGEGTIFAEDIDGGKPIRFQTPPSEIAAVARRDTIQHKFLESLYDWGSSVRHYSFGSSLGKDKMVIFDEKKGQKLDERDSSNVLPFYRIAFKEFGEKFNQVVIKDMAKLDYYIEEITIAPPISFRVSSNIPGELVCLHVKERDLTGHTDQHSMSQGMFRAFSVLIQINYSQMAKKATCILIDDIGEGLDFDRSCKLIDLMRKKAKESNIQLVLSTNDRFIMNNVPLEEWSFLQRQGGHVNVRNFENSRKIFEDFKYTGLSNFSFLELDFVNEEQMDE